MKIKENTLRLAVRNALIDAHIDRPVSENVRKGRTGDPWEYTVQNGEWHARRGSAGSWINIEKKFPDTAAKLDIRFPEDRPGLGQTARKKPKSTARSGRRPPPGLGTAFAPGTDEPDDELEVGTRVKAKWKLAWYDGEIETGLSSGKYKVRWDDGTYSHVEKNLVRLHPDADLDDSGDLKSASSKYELSEYIPHTTAGNAFRVWVNKIYDDEEIASALAGLKDDSLWTRGEHDNNYMKKAWAHFGDRYVDEVLLGSAGQLDDDIEDKITYHPTLSNSVKIRQDQLKRGEEAVVDECTSSECAQYVSDTLGSFQGNAWHAHKLGDVSNSSFEAPIISDLADGLATLFTAINKSGARSGSHNKSVKKLMSLLIKPQSVYSDLKLGDVVGLYFNPSKYHTKAYFEGATGSGNMGRAAGADGQPNQGDGPFFVNADTGKPWNPSMIGKNITFKPGTFLSQGRGFGVNTHLGFVGATYLGEPIIFHNISGIVKATPLSVMSPSQLSVVWSRPQGETRISESKNIKLLDLICESLDEAIQDIFLVNSKIQNMLNITPEEMSFLIATAIALSERESGLGSGDRYGVTNWAEVIAAEINKAKKDLAGGDDIPMPPVGPFKGKTFNTSTGQTQIKWGTIEKDLDLEYAKEIGVTRPHDLSDMTKSILAALGILTTYYKKAIDTGYSTTSPGINDSYEWSSSRNAALDMAIAAYNGGSGKISNYCGFEKLKKKCKPSDPGWIKNYIPASSRFGMSYVSDVVNRMVKSLPKGRAAAGYESNA